MGVELLTLGPGHLLLSHLPNLSDPDEINVPVGHAGLTGTLSHAEKVLFSKLGLVSLHVQFKRHFFVQILILKKIVCNR